MKTNVYARSSGTFHILGLHDVSRVFSKIYFQFCHNITFSRYELGHCSLCPPRPPAFSTESIINWKQKHIILKCRWFTNTYVAIHRMTRCPRNHQPPRLHMIHSKLLTMTFKYENWNLGVIGPMNSRLSLVVNSRMNTDKENENRITQTLLNSKAEQCNTCALSEKTCSTHACTVRVTYTASHTSALPLCVLAISTTTECSLAFILSAAMLELCRWGHGKHSCSSWKFCDAMDPGDPRQTSPGDWHARGGGACAQGGSCLVGPCCEMVTLGCAIGDLLIPLVDVVMAPTLAQCGGESGEGVLGECLFGGNEWCTWTTGA